MDSELLEILVGWVLFFSPYNLDSLTSDSFYPDSLPLPTVVERPHTFFVENVCGGIEEKCHGVVGWYNNTGIIYIDEMVPKSLRDEVVVEEIAHYVQDLSGEYDNDSCEDSIYRENEAHRIKGQYMIEVKGKLPNNKNPRTLCKK